MYNNLELTQMLSNHFKHILRVVDLNFASSITLFYIFTIIEKDNVIIRNFYKVIDLINNLYLLNSIN